MHAIDIDRTMLPRHRARRCTAHEWMTFSLFLMLCVTTSKIGSPHHDLLSFLFTTASTITLHALFLLVEKCNYMLFFDDTFVRSILLYFHVAAHLFLLHLVA